DAGLDAVAESTPREPHAKIPNQAHQLRILRLAAVPSRRRLLRRRTYESAEARQALPGNTRCPGGAPAIASTRPPDGGRTWPCQRPTKCERNGRHLARGGVEAIPRALPTSGGR